MRKIIGVIMFCLALVIISGCKEVLTKREQIASGVTVLLPEKFEKVDTNDGQILFNSKIGSANFRVFVLKNMRLDTIGLEKIKAGMEKNVTRFIEPLQGKIVQRKDTLYGKIVQSDFDFEINSSTGSKIGAGRFVVKENLFIGFIYETILPETSANKALRSSFFSSVQIDQ